MHCHKSITDTLGTVKIASANEQCKGHFWKSGLGYEYGWVKDEPLPPRFKTLYCLWYHAFCALSHEQALLRWRREKSRESRTRKEMPVRGVGLHHSLARSLALIAKLACRLFVPQPNIFLSERASHANALRASSHVPSQRGKEDYWVIAKHVNKKDGRQMMCFGG